MVDQDKRDTLRKVSQITLITATGILPWTAEAGCGTAKHVAANSAHISAHDMSPNLDLVLNFHKATVSQSGTPLCRVSLANKSKEDVTLKYFAPGTVTTFHGDYDINQRLARGDIRVGGGGEYHFWIEGVQPGIRSLTTPPNSFRRVKIKVVTALNAEGSEHFASTAMALIS